MKEPLWLLQKTTITTARVNYAFGRNSVDETIAGTNFSTNFNFDSYGRVNTRTHPSGIVETWGYNGNGFLATI